MQQYLEENTGTRAAGAMHRRCRIRSASINDRRTVGFVVDAFDNLATEFRRISDAGDILDYRGRIMMWKVGIEGGMRI